MMSALVKVMPPAMRKRLLHQTQVEFESLLAAMSAASPVQVERESVEWMRDLFLKRIARVDEQPTRRRVRKAAANAAPGKDPVADPRREPAATNVDFEL